MPEIDLMRIEESVVDVKLDASSPSFGGFDTGSLVGSGKRGRPPKTLAKGSSSSSSSPISARKKREDEDVCFVCFDGGSLILCDRRGCPKAYHPACVKRTEAFFRSKSKWNCGWHLCSSCQKDSYYKCYTCPYSVCKICVRSSEYVVVRENKGFCGICFKTIMLCENAATEANKEKVQVDFDDRGSWEYLFKIYWVSVKEKLSLSLDDLTKAKNPWKSSSSSTASKRRTTARLHNKDDGISPPQVMKASRAKVRKTKDVSVSKPGLTSSSTWATNELLDFVRYMRNGDVSVLSKYDVQTLVLEHVRRNNLQKSPQNSEIMCDLRLMRLFRMEKVDHLEMLKLLDYHFFDQERSPVMAGGVTETMSLQAGLSRCGNRLSTSQKHEERESHQLNVHDIRVGPSISDTPADNIWLYGDPDGKIHGPFSLLNLQQWNSSGHFPPELRIWRLNEQQNSSILLTDALNGQFQKTRSFQNHSIPTHGAKDTTIANAPNQSMDVAKLESRVLDFSPNSVSTDHSVITRSSDIGNSFSHNLPSDFALSNERETVGLKVESPLLQQSPISCSLSLATFPGNSNYSLSQHTDEHGAVKNTCDTGHSGAGEKQQVMTTTVQSCGQNWNATNSSVVSFTDNQEIDFLDLFTPNFNFASSTTTTTEWQHIVAGPDECDESVSDLLAEVEAMESQKCLPSPTSTFRGPEELIRHGSKGDSMSSTYDLHMHSRSNNRAA